MRAITYIPTADIDKLIWLNNFSNKIPTYASVLGLSFSEITAVQNDAAAFNFIMNLQESLKQCLQQITSYKSLMKHAINQQHLGALPSIPIINNPPAAVPEGVFDRVSKLVQRIKAHANYNQAMGNDLGIISSVSKPDTQTLQPLLKVTLDAGRPHIKCSKGIADGLDLFVNRKDGNGFVLISRLFILDYIDNAPLPTDNSIIEWEYKGRYVVGNDNVGLMSAVASVIVKKA